MSMHISPWLVSESSYIVPGLEQCIALVLTFILKLSLQLERALVLVSLTLESIHHGLVFVEIGQFEVASKFMLFSVDFKVENQPGVQRNESKVANVVTWDEACTCKAFQSLLSDGWELGSDLVSFQSNRGQDMG